MMTDEDAVEVDPGARRLKGAMLDHAGLPVERMPGLAAALEGFIAAAPNSIAPLVSRPADAGAIEPAQSTTLFQAIGDCAGLTAAIYVSAEPEARMLHRARRADRRSDRSLDLWRKRHAGKRRRRRR